MQSCIYRNRTENRSRKILSIFRKIWLPKKNRNRYTWRSKSIFLAKEKVGPVELATISFGQRFEVTPIHMVTMLSTIANKGKYVKPRLVKKIIDPETGKKREEKNLNMEIK